MKPGGRKRGRERSAWNSPALQPARDGGRFTHGRGRLGTREGLDARPVEPDVWPREGLGATRGRNGARSVWRGDGRGFPQAEGREAVPDSCGQGGHLVGGPGARSPRAARRNAGYATSIIPDYAVRHPGYLAALHPGYHAECIYMD